MEGWVVAKIVVKNKNYSKQIPERTHRSEAKTRYHTQLRNNIHIVSIFGKNEISADVKTSESHLPVALYKKIKYHGVTEK